MRVTQDRIAEANKQTAKLKKDMLANWLAQQPDKDKLKIARDGRIYAKRPEGFSVAVKQLACNLVISSMFRAKTNEQLVDWLQQKFPNYAVPKGVLTKPLLESHTSAVETALKEHGFSIDLKTYNTPSKLKKALKAAKSVSSTASYRTFAPTITLADHSVVVNERELKIIGGRIRAGGRWISVAALENLLTDI